MRLTVARLGHLGDGIAEGPVYIPQVLPGEVVEGEVTGQAMPVPRIVTPSPDRVRAPCPHYRACGGCALQHAADPFVAGWKLDVVRTALAAQGLEAGMAEIATSPARSRRRAVLSGRRTKKGVILGFHGRASGTLVAVPDCLLLEPALMAAFPALEEVVRLGASRSAELALTVTRSEGGPDVAVAGGKPLDAELRLALAGLAERAGFARLAWEGEVVALARPAAQLFGAAAVVPPPGAFLQATAAGEAALLAEVRRGTEGARRILDLFAGCGTFTLPLADSAEVHAVEGEGPMLSALDRGWRAATGLKRVTTEARDLFRRPLMVEEMKGVEAVVLDPPRAGAEAQVAELCGAGAPGRIVMVSCNPVTFARDARALTDAGFRIGPVHVVDQFRWSPHVELVATFRR